MRRVSLASQLLASTSIALLASGSFDPAIAADERLVPMWSTPGYDTFNYFKNGTNFTSTGDQPWMAGRPQLAGATADQIREFNANWGNLAVGQAAALNRGLTGSGITVGVIDTGIDATFNGTGTGFTDIHPEFAGRLDLRSRRALDNETLDLTVTDQRGGHGTHVAGTIAAARDGAGMVGVAPGANILAMKTLDAVTSTEVALTYLAGLADVRVINGSYGPGLPNNATTWTTGSLTDEFNAVKKALAAGKVLVYANGNYGDNAPIAARNPVGVSLFPFINPKNAGPGYYNDGGRNYDFSSLWAQTGVIIAVANLSSDFTISANSNRCGVAAAWCLSAPGGGVQSTPNLQNAILSTVPRRQDFIPDEQGTPSPDEPTFGPTADRGYAYFAGTSMAAPHVSGVTAVLMEAYPGYSARDIANLMFATAEDLGAPGIDAIYGHGLVRVDRALEGPTNVAGGSNIAIGAGNTTYWGQPLTTGGNVEKSGAGTLTIGGRTTSGGDFLVSDGLLNVGGTLSFPGAANGLVIGTGGTLGGFGEIVGNVVVEGTLSPGSSPGTLMMTGDTTLASTATTRIEVDGELVIPGGPGTFDKIIVNGGSFTTGGTLTPVLRGISGGNNDYTPAIGKQFQFVTAQDGSPVLGSFIGLTQPASGLAAQSRFDVIYAPSALTLSVTPTSFARLANTGGATAVAGILDRSRPVAGVRPSDTTKSVYDAFYALTSQGAYTNALGGLSGEAGGGPASASMMISSVFAAFSNVVLNRQDAVRSGGGSAQAAFTPATAFAFANTENVSTVYAQASAVPFPGASREPVSGWAIWGQVFGMAGSVGTSTNGFNSRTGGIVLGADRQISPDLLLGFAGAYSRTHADAATAATTADTYAGAVYGTWDTGRLVVDGRAAAGSATMSSNRSLAFATPTTVSGSTTGIGMLFGGEAGYRFMMLDKTVKPYLGITTQNFTRNAFTETTAFGLAFPQQSFTKVTSTAGVKIGQRFTTAGGTTLIPELKLAWGHDWRDDSLTTQAALFSQPFLIQGANPGADAAQIGLTFTAQSNSLRAFIGYDAEMRSNAQSHQISAGLRKQL